MAYDEALADRFRSAVDGVVGISEKRMMGGVCFFLNGNMVGGADRSKAGVGRLMFRVGKAHEAEAERMPAAEPMVQGGRRMPGFFFVENDDCDEAALRAWTSLALSHAAGLPPK